MTDTDNRPQGNTSRTFGFREVREDERQRLVNDVFSRVAERYDLMNDLMSGGLHRLWKSDFVSMVNPPRGEAPFRLLDVAGGTGDIAMRALNAGGPGTTAIFKPHGDFYGMVYGPDAEIQLGNDLVAFGAFAGDRILCQNPKVKLHWDEALADASGTSGGEIELLLWTPAALPDPDLLHDRRDAFTVLGVQKGELTRPDAAWDMSGFPDGF